MKRSGPPKRRKALQSDPDGVKAFIDRGRQALGRASGQLRRSEGLKRGKPRPKDPRPSPGTGAAQASLRDRVWEADRGRCVGCGKRVGRHASRWVWQAHHPIPKQTLKARLGEEGRRLAGETDSAVLTCKRCHERHETATERIPFRKLPDRVKRFAVDLGPWAEDVLSLRHPDVTQPDRGGHPDGE